MLVGLLMLWTTVGCGEAPTVANVAPREADLTEPWSAYDLPVGDGRVVWSDATVLSVQYEGRRSDELAPAWRTAVRAAGAVEEVDLTDPPLVSVRYALGEQRLALAVSERSEATTVVLSLDGAQPPR
jgi:hypothetical protein